jgi:uncharacterized protein (DUF1330 family)
MPAFILVQAKVTQPEPFKQYITAVTKLVPQFGGVYRVVAGETQLLEGDWNERKVVMHEWPSMEAARRFWFSEDYEQAKKLREGCGEFTVLLMDGLQSESLESTQEESASS